jgi:hypothetical protein
VEVISAEVVLVVVGAIVLTPIRVVIPVETPVDATVAVEEEINYILIKNYEVHI